MMNKCYSIGDLMSMYYEREFAAVEQMPIPKLSSKHNRKMKKGCSPSEYRKLLK